MDDETEPAAAAAAAAAVLAQERTRLERSIKQRNKDPPGLHALMMILLVEAGAAGNSEERREMLLQMGMEVSNVLTQLADKKPDAIKEADDHDKSFRIEDVSFQVKEQKMLHSFDVDRFSKNVADLFDWHNNTGAQNTFIAPYFPLVQSSGMGKTKLLFEFQKYVENQSKAPSAQAQAGEGDNDDTREKLKVFNDCDCVTILCSKGGGDIKADFKSDIFSYRMLLPQELDKMKTYDDISTELSEIFNQCKHTNLVFLFDESQYLLEPNDGYYFRCVRWWLRLQRPFTEKKKVVAVFTGTTSKLTNFYRGPPANSGSSREAKDFYYTEGKIMYAPFYDLCTVGIFFNPLHSILGSPSASTESDFDKAVRHGRPLFALMHQNRTLTQGKLCSILNRMLLKPNWSDDWTTNLDSCLSILGTRIQMGQTSASLASELVSKGYAVLNSFTVPYNGERNSCSSVARLSFPPDPMCARLAMGLMDEEWKLDYAKGANLKGRSKRFWVETMSLILTQGLCQPHQGNVGEMGAALYLLFCGDLIRKLIHALKKSNGDDFTTTFSIPLVNWISCLLNPRTCCREDGTSSDTPHVTAETKSPFEKEQEQVDEYDAVYKRTRSNTKKLELDKLSISPKFTKADIGFIQVVCNYLRYSVSDMSKQTFLGPLYESGCAVYVYPMCHIDLVGSIRLTDTVGRLLYVPLLVSVPTRRQKGSQEDSLGKMKMLLTEAKTFGLCLRLLFAHPGQNVSNLTDMLAVEDLKTLLNGHTVSKVLVVPENDPFGIVTNLLEKATLGPPECEVHSSQYFLQLQRPGARLVRSTAKDSLNKYANEMHETLWKAKLQLQTTAEIPLGSVAPKRARNPAIRASSAGRSLSDGRSSSAVLDGRSSSAGRSIPAGRLQDQLWPEVQLRPEDPIRLDIRDVS